MQRTIPYGTLVVEMRPLLLVLLAACWSSAPKPEVAEPQLEARIEEPPGPTCDITSFDPSNAACEELCVPTAPQGWRGCTMIAERLMTQGYICTSPTPYKCHPPPARPPQPCSTPGCIDARIIGVAINGHTTIINIAAGSNRGVTLGWTAKLIEANQQPIPNGALTLLRVDTHVTTGATMLTADQLSTMRVLLEP